MKPRMQAVVFHAPNDVRVEEVATPTCGDGEILARVDACAVCGSDLKAFTSGNPRLKPPMTIGHEFTGVIEVSKAPGYQPGERVVMATSISCGACAYCQRGWNNLCANLAPMGFSYPGGMAEYVVIPALAVRNGHVVKTPRTMNAIHAALAEPVSCAVNAAENCNLQPGDVVVVVGAGPMGLINACVARACGARQIILAEVNELRLKQGEPFGVDVRVNPAREDLAAIVKRETGGLGADVVIVTAPAAKPQEDALALTRKRGTVCLFASLPQGKELLNMNSRLIHYNELRVVGASDSTPAQVARAVDLLASGKIPADLLATHRLPLDGIRKAFAVMQTGGALRVVLVP